MASLDMIEPSTVVNTYDEAIFAATSSAILFDKAITLLFFDEFFLFTLS